MYCYYDHSNNFSDKQSHNLQNELMEKCTVDTQVHHIVYVVCVRSNNQWNKDNKPNEISWLDHIISNDEVCGLTTKLVWIEYVLDYIIDTFANIQF